MAWLLVHFAEAKGKPDPHAVGQVAAEAREMPDPHAVEQGVAEAKRISDPHAVGQGAAEAREMPAPHTVEQGVLDLRDWDLGENGPVALDGAWEFYWLRLWTPEQLETGAAQDGAHGYLQVPGVWKGRSIAGQPLSNMGYGTYRLSLRLSPGDAGRAQALDMPGVATAYKLWVNGQLLASNGTVASNREEMVPRNDPRPVYFTPSQSRMDIVLQVSNFVQRKGGLWGGVRLGRADQIASEHEKNVLEQVFIVGALMVMGLYHLGLYIFRRDRSVLFFGIACLLIGVRTLLVGEVIWLRLWPAFGWEWAVKLEYLSAFMGVAFFVLYMAHLYPRDLNRKLSYGLFFFIAVISLPILFLPARIYTYWMLYYQLVLLLSLFYIVFAVLLASIRRRKGAWINLAALVVFVLTVLNDVLYYNFWLRTGDLVQVGLFVFLFAQTMVLASRFSRAFVQVQQLSAALQETNLNLENKVVRRTAALVKSNKQLKQMEISRRHLLSDISHELGAPLTSLLGYLMALRDGIARQDGPKHIEIVYRKALMIQRLIHDLRSLVHMEERQIEFVFKPVNAADFFRSLGEKYEWDAAEKGVRFVRREIRPSPPDKLMLNIDPDRVEQVMTNLISNAVAHTKRGDTITVSGRYFASFCKMAFQVCDTGTGVERSELPFVFERFFRGTAHGGSPVDGSGLGLAISKEIIEAHGGRIGVRSEIGVRTAFYFILPVYASAEDIVAKGERGSGRSENSGRGR